MSVVHRRGVAPVGEFSFDHDHVPEFDALVPAEPTFERFEQVFPHLTRRIGPFFPDASTLTSAEKSPRTRKTLGLHEPAFACVGVGVIPLDVHKFFVPTATGKEPSIAVTRCRTIFYGFFRSSHAIEASQVSF